MSEKGGKQNGKASSLKGKGDSAARKGKSVHFSPQVTNSDKPSPAPAPAPATPSASASASASTKRRKGKGGSGSSKKDEEPPVMLKMDDLPKNSKCLMDCEVYDILQAISFRMVGLSSDSSIKASGSFTIGLQYAQRANQYTDTESVRQVIENLKQFGVTDGEMCVIAKICPETDDEVFAQVPSLKDKRIILNEPVNEVVSELAKLKRPS